MNQPEKLKRAESDTPRTDVAWFYQPSDRHTDKVVPYYFSRQLERELNEAKKEKLNAYKAGMRRAAQEVDKRSCCISEVNAVILTLAETITEKEMV